MIHLRQAVVVEGRYDKAKLASILDAVIIETGGFRIFKDKEKLAMLREIARRQGLVILTDSDTAGFRIRRYLGGSIPKEQIINAYIPDIFGKEKRKDKPSAEGKLGVEGVPAEVIRQALEQAGVFAGAGRGTDPPHYQDRPDGTGIFGRSKQLPAPGTAQEETGAPGTPWYQRPGGSAGVYSQL